MESAPRTKTVIIKPVEQHSGWCMPLYIYIGLAIINFIAIAMMTTKPMSQTGEPFEMKDKLQYALVTLIWNFAIGLLMYYLCKNGHAGWSWFILLLPLIIVLISFVFIFIAVVANK